VSRHEIWKSLMFRTKDNWKRKVAPSLRRWARILVLHVVASAFLVASGTGHAASDGSFGLISIASTEISLIRGDTAQASGLDDIVLAPWSQGQPPPVGSATACIYSGTGAYQVSASSANGAGTRFRLSSGASFINYGVHWNDGLSGLTRLGNGTPLTGLVGDATSTNCGGSNPATIQVRINRPQIETAPTGNYSDTLTVIITPQ
jgi:hypothetical protein